jgi:hypothetical protein
LSQVLPLVIKMLDYILLKTHKILVVKTIKLGVIMLYVIVIHPVDGIVLPITEYMLQIRSIIFFF